MWRTLERLTNSLDWIAGWVILASMFLVAGNVILRPFDHPITGTYEWTGFLTALAVGLALAHCAARGGHTIITMAVDKFPGRLAKVDRILVRVLTAAFLLMAAWQVAVYADVTRKSGEVAPTTKIPFYPVMFVVAIGILIYALVELAKVIRFLTESEKKGSMDFYAPAVFDSCPLPHADIQEHDIQDELP